MQFLPIPRGRFGLILGGSSLEYLAGGVVRVHLPEHDCRREQLLQDSVRLHVRVDPAHHPPRLERKFTSNPPLLVISAPISTERGLWLQVTYHIIYTMNR